MIRAREEQESCHMKEVRTLNDLMDAKMRDLEKSQEEMLETMRVYLEGPPDDWRPDLED